MSTASSDVGSDGAARSAPDVERLAVPDVERLATAVRRLLGEWEHWRQRAIAAETRARDLEGALRDVTSGGIDPLTLTSRIQALEQENRFLARRMDRARESVRRISARLQFLDEGR